MAQESDTAIKDMPRNGLSGLFLTLAVAVSLAVGSISYMNGSGPELIALKSSISLFIIGTMGWLAATLSSLGSQSSESAIEQATDPNEDVVLPEAGPADAEAISPSSDSSADR